MNFIQRFATRLFFGSDSPFFSANLSPRRARIPGAAPRDAHLDLTPGVRSELVRKSRICAKNFGFVREMVDSMAVYSVGDGLKPQAGSKNPEWNRKAEEYFAQWARRAELTGRFTLEECERLVCKAVDVDGEIFVVKTQRDGLPVIQLIETHRVASDGDADGFIDGIRLGKFGEPTAYSVMLDDGSFTAIEAESVLHIFAPDSPSQLRGFPTLQHSINHMQDEADILSLEKVAIKDNQDVTRVIKSESPDFDEGFKLDDGAANGASDLDRLQRITGGKLLRLAPGESIDSFQSQRPSSTFVGFIEHLRRDSALGLIPYEFAADSSKLAGTGVRMTIAKADRKFSARQTLIIDRMLRPLWLWIIGYAIATRALDAVEGWTEVAFTTPRRVTVDYGREAAQNREDIKLGIKTLSDHFAELGCDVKSELETRAREMKLIAEIADREGISPSLLYASYVGAQPFTPSPAP